jgi:hypothetical protein
MTCSHLSHAEQLEEGSGQGQVDEAAVLQTFSHHGAQELEHALHLLHLLPVLGVRGREQPARTLHVVAWGLHALANVDLTHTHAPCYCSMTTKTVDKGNSHKYSAPC